MNGLNKVELIGHVGRDPEIRSTQDGQKVANLTVATSDSWKDKNSGERRERTEWHRIVVFSEHIADVVERFVKKGSLIYISGQLQTRKWQAQDGSDRYSTEVVLQKFKGELLLLETKPKEEDDTGYGGVSGGNRDLDDDIPF